MQEAPISFEVFVTTAVMDEIKRNGIPQDLHGSAQPQNGNIWRLSCPCNVWEIKLVSPGNVILKKRCLTATPHDE